MLALFGLAMVKFRRLSWVDDVGLKRPGALDAAIWGLGFLILVLVLELVAGDGQHVGGWRGKYDAANLAIRILAVGLIYPVAEEFFFRGALLGLVRRRFGDVVGILVPAIVFALVHIQYDWRGMAFILLDGLIFGLARVRTGSLYVAMLLHVIGNSYAVWERLQG
jgi:membrane protease YdiL (CAAX protease family)